MLSALFFLLHNQHNIKLELKQRCFLGDPLVFFQPNSPVSCQVAMTTQPKLHRSAARPYRACAKTWPNFGRGARRIFCFRHCSRQRPNTTSGAIQGMDPRMVCLDKQIGRSENCNGLEKAVEPWNFAPTICAKFNDKSHRRNRRLKACSVNPRHVKVSSVRLEQPKSANFTVSPASEL